MPKGYRTYRGRSSRRRSVIPFLVVILFLLAAIFLLFLGLSDYLVFTSEGLRFVNPFGGDGSSSTPSPSVSDETDLIIVTPENTPTPTPTPAPTPEKALTLKAIYIPDISDPVAISGAVQLAQKGVINAVVIDMKHDDGTLAYTSGSEYAVRAGANPVDDASSSAIRQLRDAGLHLTARISAFKDNLVPRKVQSTSVKVESGVIWLDRDYHGWLNPYLDGARDYVSSIALELADLGFDEILLENFCFPTIGRPQLLYYGEYANTPRTGTLNSFAAELSEALAERDVMLSINVEPKAILEGPDTNTGQDPETLSAAVDRLFTRVGTDPQTSDLIHRTVGSYTQPQDPEGKFVPVITAPAPYDDPSASEYIRTAIGSFSNPNHGWLLMDSSGHYPPAGW